MEDDASNDEDTEGEASEGEAFEEAFEEAGAVAGADSRNLVVYEEMRAVSSAKAAREHSGRGGAADMPEARKGGVLGKD